MRPGPAYVADVILDTLELDAPPIRLRDQIAQVVIGKKWEVSWSAAVEKAERWEAATLQYLEQNVSRLHEMGRPCRVSFNTSSPDLLQGACFVEPRDSISLKESKVRRLRYSEYYAVFENLDPTQFELLCGRLIELLGVTSPQVTRRAADEGIDFYGRLSLESIFFPQDLTPTIQKQLSIWMVGQAKRHLQMQSGTSEIRDLMGAVTLGRARAFGSKEEPFKELAIRVGDPVFAMFITTGSISANAWRLLERSGIIGMDGETVAAFLADREAGLDGGAFDPDAFVRWIEDLRK